MTRGDVRDLMIATVDALSEMVHDEELPPERKISAASHLHDIVRSSWVWLVGEGPIEQKELIPGDWKGVDGVELAVAGEGCAAASPD